MCITIVFCRFVAFYQHMKQIKLQETERDSGEWHKLPAEQQHDKETGLRHLGMMGRYRNIMANHTIYTLELLTREIRDIFCHNVMVDRIAGMLNYFLEHLVGLFCLVLPSIASIGNIILVQI